VQQCGPEAIARALERMAQVEAVDIAMGPLRAPPGAPGFNHPFGAGLMQPFPAFLVPQGAAAAAAAAAAGNAGNVPGSGGASSSAAAYTQPRGYTVQHMEQLLKLLAEHRPSQKLPALYVYNECLSTRERPGLLSLKGDWRTSYDKVR